jgi:hypothetical protein
LQEIPSNSIIELGDSEIIESNDLISINTWFWFK